MILIPSLWLLPKVKITASTGRLNELSLKKALEAMHDPRVKHEAYKGQDCLICWHSSSVQTEQMSFVYLQGKRPTPTSAPLWLRWQMMILGRGAQKESGSQQSNGLMKAIECKLRSNAISSQMSSQVMMLE